MKHFERQACVCLRVIVCLLTVKARHRADKCFVVSRLLTIAADFPSDDTSQLASHSIVYKWQNTHAHRDRNKLYAACLSDHLRASKPSDNKSSAI